MADKLAYRQFPEPVVREAIMAAITNLDHPAVQSLMRTYAAWYPVECEAFIVAVDVAALLSQDQV